MELKIKAAFAELHQSLSDDEARLLEENILAHGGARDPIVVWRSFIADGHNRYRICRKHGLPFTTVALDGEQYPEASDVEEWIIRNQLGRRNLTAERFTYFIGRLYNAEKGERGGDRRASQQTANFAVCSNAAAEISEETGVSERTVRNAGKKAEALDSLPKPLKEAVLDGKVKATDKAVKALAKAEPAKQAEVARIVRTEGKSLDEAMGLKAPKEEPKAAQQQDAGFDADAWNSSIESFCRGVQAEFAKHPSGEWLDENRIGIAQGQIRSALSTLRQAKVHGKCPHCGGKGCKSCRQTGWMPKTEYESHGGK